MGGRGSRQVLTTGRGCALRLCLPFAVSSGFRFGFCFAIRVPVWHSRFPPQQFRHEVVAAAFIIVLLVIAVGTAARVW